MSILAVNVGSSSLRLSLFSEDGKVRIGSFHESGFSCTELPDFLKEMKEAPSLIVHRVVHGGTLFSSPCVVDEKTEADLLSIGALAPLHQKRAVSLMRMCRETFPMVLQMAVFDTAFYHDLPEVAQHYGLPQNVGMAKSLRRFGFHGLAHEGMWKAFAQEKTPCKEPRRVISLQLGSGCSGTAIKEGVALDTSMGFTPMDGLLMGSRSGDVDAGLIFYLLRESGLSAVELERLLNEKSGLLGVSEISSDMKTLVDSKEEAARFAIELYCYRVRKLIGAYLSVLEGVDAILIGGGVGENAPSIRRKIFEPLSFCGVLLDGSANESTISRMGRIDSMDSQVEVWVIPTEEDRRLVFHARSLLEERRRKTNIT